MKKPKFNIVSNICYIFRQLVHFSKATFFSLILLVPLSVLLSLLTAYIPKIIVENLIQKTTYQAIISDFLTYFCLFIIIDILLKNIKSYSNVSLNKFKSAMSLVKIKKILKTDYENIESIDCRMKLERANAALWGYGDGSAVEKMVKYAIEMISCVLGFLLFGLILATASPWLAVMLVVPAVIHFLFIRIIQKFQYEHREEMTQLDRRLWYIALASGSYESAKDLRIYKLKNWLLGKYKEYANQRVQWDKLIARKIFIINIFDGMLVFLRDTASYITILVMLFNNVITLDQFVLLFGAIGTFVTWINRIIDNIVVINSISYTVSDLREFLLYPEKNKPPKSNNQNLNQASIQIKDLSFQYANNNYNTIEDINLEIKAGQKIAIVGLNGAGKTTLIKVICGLYQPTKGRIIINDTDYTEVSKDEYFSTYSVVFQDIHLLPMSILSFVSSTDDASADYEKAAKCIQLAGLSKKIESLKDGIYSKLNKQLFHDGIELSGGEKQKLILARALYKESPVLILDEPTAALDPIAEKELYEQYNTLTRDRTVVFISHRLASTKFCDVILYMENGKIVEKGSHSALIECNGRYADLYHTQSKYYEQVETTV